MNKKIQREILKEIRDFNDKTPSGFINSMADVIKNLESLYDLQDLELNFNLLEMDDKIVVKNQPPYGCNVRITPKGYLEFDPLYKKIWRFFTEDMAKILSVIAIILSIIATIISFFN